jgi:hypothetical protein
MLPVRVFAGKGSVVGADWFFFLDVNTFIDALCGTVDVE